MLNRLVHHTFRILRAHSIGASMIDVVIGTVVLGLMVASIPPVMVIISNQQFRHNEERVAENMTRSQFEFIKSQDYKWGNDYDLYDPDTGHWKQVKYSQIEPPSNYGVKVQVFPIDPETGQELAPGQDEGVQKIEVTIFGYRYYEEEEANWLLQTIEYKVARTIDIEGYEVTG